MSERRAAIALVVWVIPSPTLELHDFVFESSFELGSAGGAILHWYPIGNPRSVDPIYLELRSPELAARDEQEAAVYDEACHAAGGERHYLRGQYGHRADVRGLVLADRPLILLEADPPVGKPALLHFDRRVFESPVWRGALAEALCFELSAARVGRLRERGEFTAASMAILQSRCNDLRCKVREALNTDDPTLISPQRSPAHSVPARLDPETHARAHFSEEKNGSLVLRVKEGNNDERVVVFEHVNGKPTKQLHLMKLLCKCWPRPISFRDGMVAVYGDDRLARARGAEGELLNLAERFRALLSDIRKKLDKHSINPDIVPGENPFRAKPGGLRLQLASLNGHKSQSEYDSLA